MLHQLTQLSNILQVREILFGTPAIIGPLIIPEIISLENPIINSFVKDLKKTGTKELNKDILLDSGLNIIGKKNLKRNFINYEFRNNETNNNSNKQ